MVGVEDGMSTELACGRTSVVIDGGSTDAVGGGSTGAADGGEEGSEQGDLSDAAGVTPDWSGVIGSEEDVLGELKPW